MLGRPVSIALFAALALSPALAGEGAGANGAKTKIPADVAAYVDRRIACDHWAGEEPYDAARARYIAAAAKKLRCTDIDADEARLRGRYARDPAVLKAIDAASAPDG